jgi:polyhydroxyalkanoate synthase subunit PhaC
MLSMACRLICLPPDNFGSRRMLMIWRYVVDSYLKGATPDAFDLLYWDSDTSACPAQCTVGTRATRISKTTSGNPEGRRSAACRSICPRSNLPASREDHIVPWKTAYGSKGLIGRDGRLVLAASGHVAGVINPPSRNKRSHWLNDALVADPRDWLEGAQEAPGSWWQDWDAWMKRHSDGITAAPNNKVTINITQ